MPKLFITLEDNRGNVVGFRTEETLQDAGGKNRGDVVEIVSVPAEKHFPRNGIGFVDPDSLGIDKKHLPSYLGDKGKGKLKSPEKVREEIELFGEVQLEGQE